MVDDDTKHPLDTAYDRYVAGKIMRRDLFRMLIDAVKALEPPSPPTSFEYVGLAPGTVVEIAQAPKRKGWPKGKHRKPPAEVNGHALDAVPSTDK